MAWKWELGGAARWRIARVEHMHVRIGRPAPSLVPRPHPHGEGLVTSS